MKITQDNPGVNLKFKIKTFFFQAEPGAGDHETNDVGSNEMTTGSSLEAATTTVVTT